MSLSKTALNTLIAGAFAVSLAAAASTGAFAMDDAAADTKEKCYGVVKTGHNDCADLAKVHSCMGQATVDSSASEFVVLPKGVCEKLVGGTLGAAEGTDTMTHEHEGKDG